MGMDKVGTLRWDGAVAQARMDNLLSAHYTDKQIHGVLSPYDGLSIGILSSLKGVGYGSGDLKMPIVTGQDAEVPSVKSILAASSIRPCSRTPANSPASPSAWSRRCCRAATPEINDTLDL
jgi:putative multiple sugar transport system substrate-binding protein